MAGTKRIVDLTHGGTCDACDDKGVCAVCGVSIEKEMLYYAMSGDHDHLVMREGQLGREAHGQLLCAKDYKVDFEKFYPGVVWQGIVDTAMSEQSGALPA